MLRLPPSFGVAAAVAPALVAAGAVVDPPLVLGLPMQAAAIGIVRRRGGALEECSPVDLSLGHVVHPD